MRAPLSPVAGTLLLLAACGTSDPDVSVGAWVGSDPAPASAAAPAPPFDRGERVIRVAQDGSGDLRGTDDVVLRKALGALADGGGVLEIGPGRWPLRLSLRVPSGVTMRGTGGTVLALPAPVRLAEPAARGATELLLAEAAELLPGSVVEALPPEEDFETWDASVPLAERFVQVAAVDGPRVTITRPLPRDLAAGARLGFGQKMLWIDTAADVVVENLTFDGGHREGFPMPGHQKRSAVWVGALFSHEEGPLAPPSRNVVVRHCVFRNLYGRGVALYNTIDSAVLGCVFRDVADEAIDLDHFTYRCQVRGNDVRGAVFGVTINDGSDHVVEYNRIADCRTGLTIWRLPSITLEGLNTGNVLRHNLVTGSLEKAISLGEACRGNVVRQNFVDGLVEVLEPENELADNGPAGAAAAPPEPGADH